MFFLVMTRGKIFFNSPDIFSGPLPASLPSHIPGCKVLSVFPRPSRFARSPPVLEAGSGIRFPLFLPLVEMIQGLVIDPVPVFHTLHQFWELSAVAQAQKRHHPVSLASGIPAPCEHYHVLVISHAFGFADGNRICYTASGMASSESTGSWT